MSAVASAVPKGSPAWRRSALFAAFYVLLMLAWFGTSEYLSGDLFRTGSLGGWHRLAIGALFIVLSAGLILVLLRSTRDVESAIRRGHRLPLLVQLLALVLAIVLPLLALLGFVVFENARQESRLSRSVALDLATVTAAESERFLKLVRAQIDEIANRPRVRAMDPANCDAILTQHRLLNPTFTAIVVFDLAGSAICPRRPVGGSQFSNYAGSAWFRDIIDSGRDKLRGPYIGPVSGKWIVAYLAPVRDESGKVFAVIDISFDLRQFQPVAQRKLVSGAKLSLVDANAMVVAASDDPARVGQSARGQLYAQAAGEVARTDFIDVALKLRSGEALAVTQAGETRIAGFAPVPGTNWIVFATLPSEKAFTLSLANSLTWSVPIVLLGLVLVWLIARAIESPIRAIAEAATEVAQGREPRLAPETGSSETTQVARRFNAMVHALDSSQRELQESEARFRALTLLSSDWFWELDGDLRVTEVSGIETPALAARRGALIGRHPWETVADAAAMPAAEWDELRARLLAHEAVRDFEFREVLDTRLGRVSYFSASGEPRFDASGNFLGYRGVTRNITKRKLAELATRDSEQRFRSLTELSADWYWEQDADQRFTGVYPSPLFPIDATHPRQLLGKRPWEVPGMQMSEADWAPLRESIAAQRPYFDFEMSVLGHDGIRRVWLANGIPFWAPDGRFGGYRGITRDVSERRRLEQRVDLFEMAVRQSNDMVMLARAGSAPSEPLVVFANPAYCKGFGFSSDELVGKPLRLFEGPRTDAEVLETMRARLREGRPYAGETWAGRRYGEPFALEFRIDPLRDGNGNVTHFVFVLRDITERRAAAEQLEQLNTSLERSVRQRTRELEDMLSEYEAFSYSVSHDLRAPLRSISGFANIIQSDHLDVGDEVGREHLQRVMTATEKMNRMIDAMLELGQISRVELRRQPVDLSAMARDIVAGLRREAAQRQVEFVCGERLICDGDPTLLRSVLENLIGNAWKYTGQVTDARVEFIAASSAWGKAYLVRDNGAGFNMSHARRLFTPFQRLHGSEFPGTGVGLATVQRIVRRHGGRVWAQAAPEKGASFFFTVGEQADRPAPDGAAASN